MKYQIYYHYNNGSTYKEEVSAPNAIKALKKAGAHNYLKNVMFQNGSEGTAKAYEIYEDGNEATSESAILYCSYSCTGKWYARYSEAKKPFTKELYDKLKPHLSDYFPEGSAVPTGIMFDPFVPKNLNDGYDYTDLGYLDVVIFEGTRNFWNAAQKLVAFMPYIVDRV